MLMKFFRSEQIKEIDAYTILHEPIASIDLMERAAMGLLRWLISRFSSVIPVYIFVGPGNNGGDGLALARLLNDVGYFVKVIVLESKTYSADNKISLQRLIEQNLSDIIIYNTRNSFPSIAKDAILVDCLFGSGLTRPLKGLAADLVDQINAANRFVISVDIPSGLFGEDNPTPNDNSVVKANVTLSLQFPKLSFFFPENHQFIGDWHLVNIGLHQQIIDSTLSSYHLITNDLVNSLILPRKRFAHKGDFGHCLIVAGSYGMLGASVLCSNACVRAGAGLVTVHIPRLGYSVLQHTVPEAIVQVDNNDWYFTQIPSFQNYSALAVGPGLGQETRTIAALKNLLTQAKCPIVIDADGLNIISKVPELIDLIPENTILTPHIGEFNRLFGKLQNSYARIELAKSIAKERKIIIVIKGANTQVVCPNGMVYFNTSGNPGMATAGSGDVLTGIITSFLGQGYTPIDAAVLGVYLHGKSGDIAAQDNGRSINATDICNYLSRAFIEVGEFNEGFEVS